MVAQQNEYLIPLNYIYLKTGKTVNFLVYFITILKIGKNEIILYIVHVLKLLQSNI